MLHQHNNRKRAKINDLSAHDIKSMTYALDLEAQAGAEMLLTYIS